MKFIPIKVSRTVARQILVAKKNSPAAMFGVGIAGVLTSTFLACRATLKLDPVLESMENDIGEVKDFSLADRAKLTDNPERQMRKDLIHAYLKGSYNVAKLYAPSIIITSASIGLLTGSHVTLTRRNAGVTAAYAALAKGYDEYRQRVTAELGEEKELDIHRAITTKTNVDENGKKVVAKVTDPNGWSPYAKFFDEGSPNWQKNSELNRIFIQCQQNYANHLLHARGHVFLNEVYDMLGIERISAGQVVGWIIGPDGDNYIDFGMFEASNSNFVNGYERSIILDFNVDGVIYDKL
jgi:hypothetical protein